MFHAFAVEAKRLVRTKALGGGYFSTIAGNRWFMVNELKRGAVRWWAGVRWLAILDLMGLNDETLPRFAGAGRLDVPGTLFLRRHV